MRIIILNYICKFNVLEPASKQPLIAEDLANNFKKSEYFNVNLNIVKLDCVFLQMKLLNSFRRNVFEKAFEVLTNNHHKKLNILTKEEE